MNSFNPIRSWVRSKTNKFLRTVIKNGGLAAGAQVVQVLASILETVLLARFLHIDVFGIVLILVSTTELGFGLIDFRSGEAMVKFLPELRQREEKRAVSAFVRLVLLMDIFVAMAGLALIIMLRFSIFRWVGITGDYTLVLLVLAVGTGFKTGVRSFGSYLRVSGQFPLSIKLGMAVSVFRIVLILLLLLLWPGVFSVALGISVSETVGALAIAAVTFSYFRREGLRLARPEYHLAPLERRGIIRFMLHNNLAGTVRIFSTKVDVLLLAALSSTTIVALYKVAGRFATIPLMFSDPLLLAIYPEISILHSNKQTKDLQRIFRFFTLALCLLALIQLGGFSVIGHWLISGMMTRSYTASYPAALIMMSGTAVAMVFFWTRPMLLVNNRSFQLLIVSIIALILQIASLYILIPVFGLIGAGISFFINYSTTVFMYLFLIYHDWNSNTHNGRM